MDKLQKFMEEKILPFAVKLGQQKHLSAVRDGMSVLIPLTMIGGLALVIAIPPIPADTTNSFLLMLREWSAMVAPIFRAINQLSIGVISIYVTAGISYQLAKTYELNTLTNMVSAVFIFLLVASKPADGALQMSGLGATSMFSAILIALIVVEVNNLFVRKNLVIKMPEMVPQNVAAPFTILLPTIANVALFVTLDQVSMAFLGSGITDLIYVVLQPLLGTGDGLAFILFICVLSVIFWFFGIHGGNMISIVTGPITTLNLALNAEAYANNMPLPKIWVGFYSGIFGDQLAHMALLIAIFIAARSIRLKSIAKVAVVPAMFQITEPITFGLPTVLNIMTLIPILICTVLNITVSYLLMDAGVIGKFMISLPFTVPGPLNAFLATMDIKAALLWFVLLPINVMIMMPFMKTFDKQIIEEEEMEMSTLATE